MRVLLICPGMHPRDGGPPRVVHGSAAALIKAGVEVEIVALGEPADEAETRAAWPALSELGVPLHFFPRDFPRQIGRSTALRDFVRKHADRFDLLQVHCVWEICLADAAAEFRKCGKPVLLSPHGMLDRWQLRRSRLKKAIAQKFFGTGAMLAKADAILFGTQEEADEAGGLGFGKSVVIMPNGVNPLVLPDRVASRHAMEERFPQLAGWKRTVIFFSRLHPKKGLDMLVEAFGMVHRDFPNAGLFAAAIAQDAAYEAKVRAQIAGLGQPNIILTTELTGPSALQALTSADIFALPSHQEGFSIAIVEAAGAGLPLLITRPCHMADVEEQHAGIVVEADPADLARGLRTLLAMSEDELAELGRNGIFLVSENYTWDRVAERLKQAYSTVSQGSFDAN